MAANVTYHLQTFDGPLDLLLHLIAKNKVSIYDIPIAEILAQYVEYISQMKSLDLEIASEFITMAAQLLYIKSKMLLPVYEIESEEDPRAALVDALLEYQRFQKLSGALSERLTLGAGVYTKMPEPQQNAPKPEYHCNVSMLIAALEDVFGRAEHKLPPPARMFTGIVGRESVPVSDKIDRIIALLVAHSSVLFEDIVMESRSRSEIVAVFLAVLELSKSHKLYINNSENGYLLSVVGE